MIVRDSVILVDEVQIKMEEGRRHVDRRVDAASIEKPPRCALTAGWPACSR